MVGSQRCCDDFSYYEIQSAAFERMARRLDLDVGRIRWAVDHLVGLGLIAARPGAGGRANTYLPAPPKRIAVRMATATVDDAPASPF
jgi:hypothetical protein